MSAFKLQAVLDYRKRLADAARKNLQQSIEAQQFLSDARAREEREMIGLCEDLQAAKCVGMHVPDVLLYEHCIGSRKRDIAELDRKLLEAEEDVRRKRAELVKASQEKRVLEILKEKQEAEKERKHRHQENNFLDEIAVLGFGGRR